MVRPWLDVIEAFTYYAHREKLRLIDRERDLEPINRTALAIAKKVAAEGGALVAGNLSNTNIFKPGDTDANRQVRAMFEEQVGWAAEAGVDYIIAETIPWLGEAAGRPGRRCRGPQLRARSPDDAALCKRNPRGC